MTNEEAREKAYRTWDNAKRRHGLNVTFGVFLSLYGYPPTLTHGFRKIKTNLPYAVYNLEWFKKKITNKEKRDHKTEISSDFNDTLERSKQ